MATFLPRSSNRRMAFWVGVIMLIAAIFYFDYADRLNKWPTTNGTVIKHEGLGKRRNAIVSYSVDGKTYETSIKSDANVGSLIPLSYNPDNPYSTGQTSKGANEAGIAFLVLGLLFTIGALILKF